jgi:Rap guanine nucleotide exchange factor 2
MGKYRSLLAQTAGQTPMIPFYPVVRKDLTFIDLGNSTRIDGLINFEKMRMVAKEIRQLVQMSAAPFDTSSQPTMAAMNQLVTKSGTQLTTTTGKRRKKNNGPPNPKKMFEEMNMIRKVKVS